MTLEATRTPALPRSDWKMLIGGEWAGSSDGKTFATYNPANGEKLADVPAATPEDVDRAVRTAHQAFKDWRRLEPLDRAKLLDKLAARLRQEARTLGLIDALDSGNTLKAMINDVTGAAERMEYAAGLALELKGSVIPQGWGTLNYVLRQPYGVVSRIVPFNHPIQFAIGTIAAPLIAGNTVVLKPSSVTPLSALELARIASEVLPPGVLNVVTGGGEVVGNAMVTHPLVHRVALTGSVETGRQVMKLAADGIKHVSLELGGKNPIIILPDADLDKATTGAVNGMNFAKTQSQSCGSTTRAFVHKSLHRDFVDLVVKKAEKIKIGMPHLEETEMGCLVSPKQFEKVMGYIKLGNEQGAQLRTGGGKPAGEIFEKGTFVAPTVFDEVRSDMRIAQEEIFGPVLSVIPWENEDEVLQQANSVIFGLTASIWTNDLSKAMKFAEEVESGYVWINNTSKHTLGAPFGGYKQSGLGREETLDELLSYTQLKNVHVNWK